MNDKLKNRIRKYLDDYLSVNGYDITKDDMKSFVGKYLTTTNRCNHYSNIRFLNDILHEYDYDITLDSSELMSVGLTFVKYILNKTT